MCGDKNLLTVIVFIHIDCGCFRTVRQKVDPVETPRKTYFAECFNRDLTGFSTDTPGDAGGFAGGQMVGVTRSAGVSEETRGGKREEGSRGSGVNLRKVRRCRKLHPQGCDRAPPSAAPSAFTSLQPR